MRCGRGGHDASGCRRARRGKPVCLHSPWAAHLPPTHGDARAPTHGNDLKETRAHVQQAQRARGFCAPRRAQGPVGDYGGGGCTCTQAPPLHHRRRPGEGRRQGPRYQSPDGEDTWGPWTGAHLGATSWAAGPPGAAGGQGVSPRVPHHPDPAPGTPPPQPHSQLPHHPDPLRWSSCQGPRARRRQESAAAGASPEQVGQSPCGLESDSRVTNAAV